MMVLQHEILGHQVIMPLQMSSDDHFFITVYHQVSSDDIGSVNFVWTGILKSLEFLIRQPWQKCCSIPEITSARLLCQT